MMTHDNHWASIAGDEITGGGDLERLHIDALRLEYTERRFHLLYPHYFADLHGGAVDVGDKCRQAHAQIAQEWQEIELRAMCYRIALNAVVSGRAWVAEWALSEVEKYKENETDD